MLDFLDFGKNVQENVDFLILSEKKYIIATAGLDGKIHLYEMDLSNYEIKCESEE